jgi:hypothetical protein
MDYDRPLCAPDRDEDLRDHFNAIDGLVCESDLEIARELVRRARRAEQVEAEVRRLRRLA